MYSFDYFEIEIEIKINVIMAKINKCVSSVSLLLNRTSTKININTAIILSSAIPFSSSLLPVKCTARFRYRPLSQLRPPQNSI